MKERLEQVIIKALKTIGIEADAVSIDHPTEFSHGDFSTNVALVYAKKVGKNPKLFAEEIISELSKNKIEDVEKIELAGAGFINFYLTRDFFTNMTGNILKQGNKWGSNGRLSGKKIMVEYTDPNPFKPFHIGHLMSNTIGESIARVISFSGANVVHANYQGDVGLHVAKAIYGLFQKGKPDTNLSISMQAEYIGECYSFASNLYDTDENIKKEIDVINKKVYERSDSEINNIYDWGRTVTLEAFEKIYALLGTKFQHYFFESAAAPIGVKAIQEHLDTTFTKSDGAIVFQGEKYDPKLHTRVFITAAGLPTYEAKEIGLTLQKFELENPDQSIVITANEQSAYFQVVTKAITVMYPEMGVKMKHISHGMMRLASGKMSSRKGNVVTGESLLKDSMDIVREKVADREWDAEMKERVSESVGVSALKYSILHQAIGGNIIYDFDKSISFEGDSGPYLQYSATRALSVLKKAEVENIIASNKTPLVDVTSLERTLYKFPEIVDRASVDLAPHHIATYLIELATSFNSFYANHPIVDKNDDTSPYKVSITQAFLTTMTNGLNLLGITVPEKM